MFRIYYRYEFQGLDIDNHPKKYPSKSIQFLEGSTIEELKIKIEERITAGVEEATKEYFKDNYRRSPEEYFEEPGLGYSDEYQWLKFLTPIMEIKEDIDYSKQFMDLFLKDVHSGYETRLAQEKQERAEEETAKQEREYQNYLSLKRKYE